MTNTEPAMLARLNEIEVITDDLMQVAEECADMPAHEWQAGLHVIARLFRKQGQKPGAVMFRMEALASMTADPRMERWALSGQPKGSVAIPEQVFAAASSAPLIQGEGNRVTFDADDFFERVMKHAEPEGQA